jgi:hypothetical protein
MLAALLVTAAIAQPQPQTSLRIAVWPEGRAAGGAHHYTLRCGPAGGTLPRAAEACRVLTALGDDAFRPIPKDAACTQVYGGPSEAIVVGRFEGRTVWTRFRRRDGCEIARWRRHDALFPVGGDK